LDNAVTREGRLEMIGGFLSDFVHKFGADGAFTRAKACPKSDSACASDNRREFIEQSLSDFGHAFQWGDPLTEREN
jgi:hypothetical protein